MWTFPAASFSRTCQVQSWFPHAYCILNTYAAEVWHTPKLGRKSYPKLTLLRETEMMNTSLWLSALNREQEWKCDIWFMEFLQIAAVWAFFFFLPCLVMGLWGKWTSALNQSQGSVLVAVEHRWSTVCAPGKKAGTSTWKENFGILNNKTAALTHLRHKFSAGLRTAWSQSSNTFKSPCSQDVSSMLWLMLHNANHSGDSH